MGSDGQQARKVLEVDGDRAVCCMYFFGGSRVAYVTIDDSGSTLLARDLNRGPLVTLMAPPSLDSLGDFAWLPDGRFIYSDNCTSIFVRPDTPCSYWIERFDIRSGVLTERPRRLTKVVGASISKPSATADGRRVAFLRSTGYGTAFVAELGVGATSIRNTRHFTLEEGDDAISDWTPDSHTAIIVRNRGDHAALYKQALDSEVAEPIVANLDQGVLSNAVLSPDAKWIILQFWPRPPPPGLAPPRTQIWRVPIGGGALRQLFSLAPGSTINCAWAPATLCVTAEPTADRKQIIVAPFDPASGLRGTELLRFDRYPNPEEDNGPLAFGLSPDGQWVSTSVAPAGPLRILSLHGDPARVLSVRGLNVKHPAAWTADGRGLIVTTYREDAAVLLHVDLQGNARELFKCESAQPCFGYPSPDGSHLGIYQTRTAANIWMLDNS
jgi:Tol biopolymer transport system component